MMNETILFQISAAVKFMRFKENKRTGDKVHNALCSYTENLFVELYNLQQYLTLFFDPVRYFIQSNQSDYASHTHKVEEMQKHFSYLNISFTLVFFAYFSFLLTLLARKNRIDKKKGKKEGRKEDILKG